MTAGHDLYEKKTNGACFCGVKTKLHVHHVTYERLGNEHDADLRLVCEAHHDLIHAYHKSAGIPHTLQEATDEFIKLYKETGQVKKTKTTYPPTTKQRSRNYAGAQIRKKKASDKKVRQKLSKDALAKLPWDQLTKKQKAQLDNKRHIRELRIVRDKKDYPDKGPGVFDKSGELVYKKLQSS